MKPEDTFTRPILFFIEFLKMLFPKHLSFQVWGTNFKIQAGRLKTTHPWPSSASDRKLEMVLFWRKFTFNVLRRQALSLGPATPHFAWTLEDLSLWWDRKTSYRGSYWQRTENGQICKECWSTQPQRSFQKHFCRGLWVAHTPKAVTFS